MSAQFMVSWKHEDGRRQTSIISGCRAAEEALSRAEILAKDPANLPVMVERVEVIARYVE